MLKKTLGFGFVAGTAMLAVALSSGGCSSTTTTTPADAATDGKAVVHPDGSTEAGPSACPGAAPTPADFDKDPSGGWKPPGPVQANACSTGDLTAFEANFKTAANYNDLTKGLPAACTSCLAGLEAGATWPLIVIVDATGDLGFVNFGACYARGPNGSDPCGKAVQYSEFCLNASCSGCADSAETTTCQKDTATQDACTANFGAGIQSGCGTDTAKLTALDSACSKVTTAAAVLCGGGAPADAGGGG